MSRTPPPFDKDGMDSFSERTYNNENTPYNIELNRLRSHLPDAQPARPRSMEYGYNPRYDSINNAPAEKSSRGMRRAERVFATMCCGSCLCFLLWIVLGLLIVGVFTALLVKILHHPVTAAPVVSATSIPAMEPSTITVTQSTVSVPISITTAFSTETDTTTLVSFSTLTTTNPTTVTYTPPDPKTYTVTSEKDGTTITSVVTSADTTTTTQSPIPTSVVTETSVTVTSFDVTTTATSGVTTTSGTTLTSTITTTTRNHDDNDDEDNNENDLDTSRSRTASSTTHTIATSRRTTSSHVSKSMLSDAHGPVAASSHTTSSSTTSLNLAITEIMDTIGNVATSIQTTRAPTSSSRESPLPGEGGNRHPTPQPQGNHHTKRREPTELASLDEHLSSTEVLIVASDEITLKNNPILTTNIMTVASSASLSTFDWTHSLQPIPQSVVTFSNPKVPANIRADHSSKTGADIHTRIDASTPSADEFPVTENLGAISAKITSYEGVTSKYTSTNAAIENARADALSSMRSEYSSVTSWCSEHNTDGAALSIKSYCGPGASANTRRDTVPTTMIPNVGDVETTLITKYISITNIVTLTSTTSLSTADSIDSTKSTQPSRSSSLTSPSSKTFNRRKDILAAWGVTNLHHPAEIGTNILRLPPHHWDCVRQPRTCATLLSLIGALCGIPFGMILFVFFQACFRCCMKRRAEKKFEEERKKKPGLDAAIERLQLSKLGARLGGDWSWAGSGGKKEGRRGSDATIELGQDRKY